MASSADFWYVWIVVVGASLLVSRWCYYQRRRYLVRQQLLQSSSPAARGGVQMIDVSSLPSPPPGYITAWVDGRIVFQPHFSIPSHVEPPPSYQSYPPGVAAVPAPYPTSPSAVVAVPMVAPPSYRLVDVDGAEPIPEHLKPLAAPPHYAERVSAVHGATVATSAAVDQSPHQAEGRQGETAVTLDAN